MPIPEDYTVTLTLQGNTFDSMWDAPEDPDAQEDPEDDENA